jgi:L-alanine-DL-glutamate epimerase-like enolase superfamily enzyme
MRPAPGVGGAADASGFAAVDMRTAMPRITCLRTIRIAERPNLLWVEIETDEGLTGLGESFRGVAVVEGQLHEQVVSST